MKRILPILFLGAVCLSMLTGCICWEGRCFGRSICKKTDCTIIRLESANEKNVESLPHFVHPDKDGNFRKRD